MRRRQMAIARTPEEGKFLPVAALALTSVLGRDHARVRCWDASTPLQRRCIRTKRRRVISSSASQTLDLNLELRRPEG